jgi:hypothetical protein
LMNDPASTATPTIVCPRASFLLYSSTNSLACLRDSRLPTSLWCQKCLRSVLA